MPSSNPRLSARPRPIATAAVCAAAVCGIALTTGIAATAPASAPAAASAAVIIAAAPAAGFAAAPTAWGVETLTTSTTDAQATLDRAEAAVASVPRLQTEIASSGLELATDTSIDTAPLREAADRLSAAAFVPALLFPELADDAAARSAAVEYRVDAVREALESAVAQEAAAEAAAAAAAEAQRQAEAAAAAEAQRQAEALAAANTPEGARVTAQRLAAERYGWGGDQFSCLSSLWEKESNWNYRAYNASSGATGIPQALPGSKMATAGSDWQTNAATQIAWGLDYIDRAYGAPCSAWGHSQATNWY